MGQDEWFVKRNARGDHGTKLAGLAALAAGAVASAQAPKRHLAANQLSTGRVYVTAGMHQISKTPATCDETLDPKFTESDFHQLNEFQRGSRRTPVNLKPTRQ